MKRFFLLFATLTLAGLVAAQTVALTTDEDAVTPSPDQLSIEDQTAVVTQTVTLDIPAKVGLHLDVSNLEFNLADINTSEMMCVYGVREDDWPLENFLGDGQDSYVPLGVYYATGQDVYSDITLLGQNGATIVPLTQYPPAVVPDGGELMDGTKAGFVCFRTFVLQKFSNYDAGFDLSVARTNGTFDMYVQDNSACSIFDGGFTGFYRLDSTDPYSLLPEAYRSDTTGALSDRCATNGNSKGGW
ncbi:MAG: hypothetical protein LC667_08900, partial [Thioalkalivibrio sp.]|nr:hypothetical protein [Thioalkalivibrio sp.]